MRSVSIDPGTQLASIPALEREGIQRLRRPRVGLVRRVLQLQGHHHDFDKVIAQPYMRGVFAELIDQTAIINGVYHGWAVPAYGPVASAPKSPYVPRSVTKPD